MNKKIKKFMFLKLIPFKSELFNRGGVALEYVLVTTFATVFSLILIGVITNITKKKLNEVSDKLGITINDIELNPFSTTKKE